MSKKPDDENEIEASRAPLLDHLIELRSRLVTAIVALLAAFIGCFLVSEQIFLFLTDPFIAAVHRVDPERAREAIKLYNTDAMGFFVVKVKVALFAAIVLAFPVIAWQAYAFIAPGLYKRERSAVAPFLVAAPIMFLLGATFVYFVAMPFALEFALNQQVTVGQIRVEYLPKVDEYIALVTTLVLAFGLFFQMPVVLALLARIGVVSTSMLLKSWRYALVGIAAFAALVTPPDVLSMSIMAVPMFCVFLASVGIVWLIERGRPPDGGSEVRAAAE
ncbi:MAG TPA: twin-arginine translocase subunit TatC [Caulobacterales bacterium]|nr:twin-arginine translocase subunit TatC [Caulobacterales bacterium]